jgi:hypothetical protein
VTRRSDTNSFMEASLPSEWKTMCFSEEAVADGRGTSDSTQES